jgi:Na+/melibiose symporter-like transporter
MHELLLEISLWLRGDGFRISWLLYLPVVEVVVLLLFFRKTFLEKGIIVFGIVNFVFIYLYLLLGTYYSKYEIYTKYHDITIQYISSNLLKSFTTAFVFSGIPLIIFVTYLIHKRYSSRKQHRRQIIYSVLTFVFSVFSFIWLWGALGDAADCEKLPSEKEKAECRQKL